MGIAPVAAVPKILSQVGLAKEDVDVYEVSCLHSSSMLWLSIIY